jgi:hypothetical protein
MVCQCLILHQNISFILVFLASQRLNEEMMISYKAYNIIIRLIIDPLGNKSIPSNENWLGDKRGICKKIKYFANKIIASNFFHLLDKKS